MPTTLRENGPSAGIGVVEVQKPMVFFCDFCGARATLCGDKNWRFLLFFTCSRDPLRGSVWSRCKNPRFLRCLTCPRDPLRGSVWSSCKNSRFFAIFNMLARPSAGIGVVEVQKPWLFAIFNMPARPSAGIGVVEMQKSMKDFSFDSGRRIESGRRCEAATPAFHRCKDWVKLPKTWTVGGGSLLTPSHTRPPSRTRWGVPILNLKGT